jgi:hypothetical protein
MTILNLRECGRSSILTHGMGSTPCRRAGVIMNRHKVILALIAAALVAAATSAAFNLFSPPSPASPSGLRDGLGLVAVERV